jgi:ketosteroid isomerase-like protein
MADNGRAQTFADALQKMESSGDATALLSQFADGAELSRPELDKAHGPTTDPEQFWSAYRDQFSELSTEFDHIDEEGDLAVLEWTSRGTLSAGRSIEYRGVSILGFDDSDKVARFSTYYDTAAFVVPAS